MDSPSSETALIPVSDVAAPMDTEEEELGNPKIPKTPKSPKSPKRPKIEGSQSSEETIPDERIHGPQPMDTQDGGADGGMEDQQEEDREYGCRYCDKTFSNKQALGGHQNAHKVERTLEKTVRDVHDSGMQGYIGSSSASNHHPHFLNSYQRTTTHDFISRSYLSWPYPSQQLRNVPIGYASRPGMADPYGPRAVPGYNHAFATGWSPAPLARLPQLLLGPAQAQPSSSYGPGQGLSLRFGEGSSSSGSGSGSGSGSRSARPVIMDQHYQSLTAFAGTWRLGPGGNPSRLGEGEVVDESGLDLTLKL